VIKIKPRLWGVMTERIFLKTSAGADIKAVKAEKIYNYGRLESIC
jgi:hypothetical protein